MKHIVSVSGGVGSYFTLKRVLEKTNKEDVIPVFMDTLAEDGDGESINYMYDDKHVTWMPPFEKGTMYKNMELYKWYTLEELEINYDK